MRVLAAAVALSALALSAAEPAAAVQTTSYKLAATGPRTKLVHGYGAGAVHDTFLVANLTGSSLTLTLDVVGATLQGNDYALGSPGQGFAARVHINDRQVTLKPHEQRTLPVVIDRPTHTAQALYAAITAQPQSAPTQGIGVQTRLALLVEVTPTPERLRGGSSSTATSVARVVAVIVAAGLVLGLILLFVRRRHRSDETP